MASEARLRTRLARLRHEVGIDAQAMEERSRELATALTDWPKDHGIRRADLMLIAVNLHGYYTALETLCERVARQFDESMPSGATWHAELLGQMQVEVPGLRPPVIPAKVMDDLHELRKFRHFFRNAYVLDFAPELLRTHAERVGRVQAAVAATLSTFRRHVDDLLAKLGSD